MGPPARSSPWGIPEAPFSAKGSVWGPSARAQGLRGRGGPLWGACGGGEVLRRAAACAGAARRGLSPPKWHWLRHREARPASYRGGLPCRPTLDSHGQRAEALPGPWQEGAEAPRAGGWAGGWDGEAAGTPTHTHLARSRRLGRLACLPALARACGMPTHGEGGRCKGGRGQGEACRACRPCLVGVGAPARVQLAGR
jgi:hypothetical protein